MSNTEQDDREQGASHPGSRMYDAEPAEGVVQRGAHGEGAETIGNSVRGALSGGLSGATTTRGGQQGGIGASVYDAQPAVVGESDRIDDEHVHEQDLTLGQKFGGTMKDPRATAS